MLAYFFQTIIIFRCIWVEKPSTPGSPMCYYADNDGYRMIGEPKKTDQGYVVMLERQAAIVEPPYGREYQNLLVTVTEVTGDTVRIKVSSTSFIKIISVLIEFNQSGNLSACYKNLKSTYC